MIKYLDKILEWAVMISFIGMIVTVLIQVIARNGLLWSPNWTEELSRFCFIYMVSIGAGLAVKDKSYVSVTVFLDKFRGMSRLYMENVILLSIILLMLCMFIYSIPLIRIVTLQSSAAMQVNMGYMYFSMTCMSLFVMLYSIIQLQTNLKKTNPYL